MSFREALRPAVELVLRTSLSGGKLQRLEVLAGEDDVREWVKVRVAFSVRHQELVHLHHGEISFSFPLDCSPDPLSTAVALVAQALQRREDQSQHETDTAPEEESPTPR